MSIINKKNKQVQPIWLSHTLLMVVRKTLHLAVRIMMDITMVILIITDYFINPQDRSLEKMQIIKTQVFKYH
jgi:hypothetical protein